PSLSAYASALRQPVPRFSELDVTFAEGSMKSLGRLIRLSNISLLQGNLGINGSLLRAEDHSWFDRPLSLANHAHQPGARAISQIRLIRKGGFCIVMATVERTVDIAACPETGWSIIADASYVPKLFPDWLATYAYPRRQT